MEFDNYETVLLSKEGPVTTITLNRPEFLNALSPKLMHELDDVLEFVAKDTECRAVVITGAGRAFTSGGDVALDVAVVHKMPAFEWREYDIKFCSVIKRIYWMEKPVIAAVNGPATGGGLDLALACDIRIASDKAKFGMFYVRVAGISDLGGIYLLPRIIGLGRAKLMAFTGDLIGAEEAEHFGIVDKLVKESEFVDAVHTLSHKLGNMPTKAIGMTKQAMHRSLEMNLDTSLDYCNNAQLLMFSTEDFQEGFSSFMEKRKPVFKGR